ncbi:uncharacterized protein LOC107038849 [Diachasma alloeum]|uniref:uncharacterized protein LOC107038849 n=1 Tax=Diachasma alloeum TaxID=454923 RepID=UPI0007381380|nr:uncharacterized protein LOC107038849 [Diachasma alloeum]
MRYLPSLAKLCRSFRLRSREFLRENTLHGFNYFVDPSRPVWERVLWFLCTLASLGAAICSIAITLIKFTTAPMLTVVHMPKSDVPILFPAVIACPSSEYLDLRNYTEEERNTLIKLYDWNWRELEIPKSFKVTPDLRHLFENSMPDCKDMFRNCSLKDIRFHCSAMFVTVSTQQGKCCATRPFEMTIYKALPTIKFIPIFDKRMNLYFQPHWFLPRGGPISYRLIHNVSFSISMQVTITQEGARLFDASTRGCIMPDEGTSPSECQIDCQKAVLKEELSCVPWWIKGDSTPTCRLSEYNKIIRSRTRFDKCYDDCPLLCNTTWYNIDKIHLSSENVTSISVKHWPLVGYKRKVIFGLLELLVSFGGIMGLFLGYSVLTTVEFIYYFTLRPYCGAIISEEERNVESIRVFILPRKRKPLDSYSHRSFHVE